MSWTEEEIEDVLRYYFADMIVERILEDLRDQKHAEEEA